MPYTLTSVGLPPPSFDVLRQAGLVDRRREGRRHFYRVESGLLRELLEWLVALDEFWAQELDALGDRLEDDRG